VRLYERFVLPRLTHLVCGLEPNRRQRAKVVPQARGEVLELGFGSGLNLSHYDTGAVRRIRALEPSVEMWELAGSAVATSPLAVEHLASSAEEIPLADSSVDTVVVTYTLCTIPDPGRALREARRVLAPGGRLLFCEHGLAPDPSVRRWQSRLSPVWRRLAGGCRLDRDIPALIGSGGFALESLSTMYLPGWRPASYNFWGTAAPI